ncbi:MAG: hypothetical protein E7231_14125 [Cellulosilyticum sp.]|nr:hypothetical protein [Cellulosilyticum sp.]
MKIGKIFLILTIIVIFLGGAYFYYIQYNEGALPSFINTVHTTNKKYIIEKSGRIVTSVDTLEEAIEEAKKQKRAIAINTYNGEWVYSEFKPFFIVTENAVHDFEDFREAVSYAKSNEHSTIYYKNKNTIIWESNIEEVDEIYLDVPLIAQQPELDRGCEVTSLAMILRYAGFNVDKLELAEKIKKEKAPCKAQNGRIQAGNPYDGFVGDMYSIDNPGYGVYHGPIVELAQQYCGNRVVDLTGLSFEEITYMLQKGYPIWIITNADYRPLDDSKFQIWHTPTGIVKITYRLHSVVITGISEENIYINDPSSNTKNNAYNKEKFIKAWEQMGNQAIAILN